MAKQCGPATFLGTYMDIIGYADDDRALVRMNGVMDKAKWKRHPSFERTREAARYFGAASVIAAGIWRNVPRGLKWIMEGEAYGRLVGACRGLVGKDGNISDPEGLKGVDLNGWSLPELRDERLEMRVSGAAVSDEGGKMAFEDLRHQDESRSLLLGRKRKYVMAEPFTDHEDPDFVVEHERLGTIESFREGLRELRALEGKPVVRRRRTWVAACEIGTVELVLGHGKSGKFFLEQRGRYWLGKADYCSPWVVDHCTADFDESGEMRDESYAIREAGVFDESGKRKDESGLGDRIREVVREAALSSEGCEKRTGWFVVIVGTEVAEKRGRHWVRLPYCCGVRVADVVCLNQNLQNSPNSQDCLRRSQDSQDGEHAFQDLGSANGDGAAVDLEEDGMGLEIKNLYSERLGADFREGIVAGIAHGLPVGGCLVRRGYLGWDVWGRNWVFLGLGP